MSFGSRVVEVTAVAMLLAPPGGAVAAQASAWDDGFHSRARLVSGGTDQGRRLAGIEIVLDPGFKTYWRNPGESGLPPRFDWSGSTNAQAIDLKWPVPERTEDSSGVSFGYHDRVTFPIVVRPANPGEPVRLSLSIDYGVCRDLCIPAHAELALDLSGDEDANPLVKAALDAVPRPQALGAPGDLSILGIAPRPDEASVHRVDVRAPEGTRPELFAEAPEGWYLSTAPAPGGGFLVKVEERPKDAKEPVPVTLTLAAGGRAVETAIRLAPSP